MTMQPSLESLLIILHIKNEINPRWRTDLFARIRKVYEKSVKDNFESYINF